MRIQTFIGIICLPLSATSEPFMAELAAAFVELSAALSPCSALRSNPALIPHPSIPNLWIVPHTLPVGSWEKQALIAVGMSRLFVENRDTSAFIAALSDSKKIGEWTEIIAGELGLSSKKPVDLDIEKLEVALEGLPFNAQWLSDLSQVPAPEQTVFLITQGTDWAVVARIAPDCWIILHSGNGAEVHAQLTPFIGKIVAP